MKKVFKALFVTIVLLGLIGIVSYLFILPPYATSQCKELYLLELEKYDQETYERVYEDVQEEIEQTCNIKNGSHALYLMMQIRAENN